MSAADRRATPRREYGSAVSPRRGACSRAEPRRGGGQRAHASPSRSLPRRRAPRRDAGSALPWRSSWPDPPRSRARAWSGRTACSWRRGCCRSRSRARGAPVGRGFESAQRAARREAGAFQRRGIPAAPNRNRFPHRGRRERHALGNGLACAGTPACVARVADVTGFTRVTSVARVVARRARSGASGHAERVGRRGGRDAVRRLRAGRARVRRYRALGQSTHARRCSPRARAGVDRRGAHGRARPELASLAAKLPLPGNSGEQAAKDALGRRVP